MASIQPHISPAQWQQLEERQGRHQLLHNTGRRCSGRGSGGQASRGLASSASAVICARFSALCRLCRSM